MATRHPRIPRKTVDRLPPAHDTAHRPPVQVLPSNRACLTEMGDYRYVSSPIQRRTNTSDLPEGSETESGHALPVASVSQPNLTGLPDRLKMGLTHLSGMAMDDVRVHYNSALPARLEAFAFAQGSNIHLAPGQESHLPHEAWHVVQQKQGRVQATMQTQGLPVNDAPSLEKEADVMGRKAASMMPSPATAGTIGTPDVITAPAMQLSPSPFVNKDSGNTSRTVQLSKKYSKKEKATLLERLRKSFRRNRKKKARPKILRYIFRRQRRANYGYQDADIATMIRNSAISNALTLFNAQRNARINPSYSQIDVGDARGYFRKGFGGQPFLYLDSDAYGDKMIGSNYDEIIAHFSGNDAKIAMEILHMIESGESGGTDRSGQAKSLLLLLTQFIEAHSSRVPGADKLARALLRRIALGQLTFKQAFNRKNGLFVSAWAKKGGAPQGGQVAGRTLFDFNKDSDKYDFDDLEAYLGDSLMDELLETVDGYYSDDSDTEDDDDFNGSDENRQEINNASLKGLNAALTTLGISTQLNNTSQVAFLPTLTETIKKQYLKLVLQHHPDKGGNPDTFNAINQARATLLDVIAQFSKTGFIDFSQRNIDAILEREGYRAEPVAGNGNCFYAAVLDQIAYLDSIHANPDLLRQRVAQLIIDNAAHFRVFVVGGQLDQIVDDILTSRSWRNMGGDFAPQLIATVLQRPVQIIQPTGPITIQPIHGLVINHGNTFITGNHAPITLIYNGISHYDSTRSTRNALL